MDFKDIFNIRLKSKADELGYSASTIGKKLNIPRATVSQWFSGVAFPRPESMKKLADLLCVSVSWLKGGPKTLDDIQPLTMDQIEAIAALAPKEKAKPRHEDLIKEFQDQDLAIELNQLLVEIEKRDPDRLKREVKSFLEWTLEGLKINDIKKNQNHNGG
jgi:transcriptional regulator with XRE-family HTH domain